MQYTIYPKTRFGSSSDGNIRPETCHKPSLLLRSYEYGFGSVEAAIATIAIIKRFVYGAKTAFLAYAVFVECVRR